MSIPDHLSDEIKLELYKLKAELQEKHIKSLLNRESYYQSQNQYMLETINAKLSGVNSSSIYVASNALSTLDLTPEFISGIIKSLTLKDMKGGFEAISHFIYKNMIHVDEGYAPRMVVSNKNGSCKYLLNGKVYPDIRLVYFTSLIHEPLLARCFTLFNEDIECPICLKTFMTVKNLKLNNNKFRKYIGEYLSE